MGKRQEEDDGPFPATHRLVKERGTEVGHSFNDTNFVGEEWGKMTLTFFGEHRGLVANNTGGLSGYASGHPVEKSGLLWGGYNKVWVAQSSSGVPLLGCQDVAEPVPFVRVGLCE